ncbi:hypothetical protein DICVIV_12344 [Dictyocaulus viviparus]|uniref:NAD-dependent epimerase/dehydratase domain-containing protein n=1 Tax=Dictyocaulus viviparus TaxID=29172 RepID=A0A0D8XDG7_DICVI|nr:hypothetical protein DICVIV_12344 [Dictyocaulus viviparus]
MMLTENGSEGAEVVLVTGASGYVALHCVEQLLAVGYTVRGTVRDKSCQKKVNYFQLFFNITFFDLLRVKMIPLQRLADENRNGRLELVEADIENPLDWPRVMKGCSFVLHVASPWPVVADSKTIRTAVEGTLNILRTASTISSIKKVVITSSCAAINGISSVFHTISLKINLHIYIHLLRVIC